MTTTTTDRRQGVTSSVAIKAPVKVATTGNITLSGTQTIDGVAVTDGDRVLVKDQTDGSENGIYDVATSSWSRSSDWDGSYDVDEGTRIIVNEGNNAGIWRLDTDDVTIGTTSITFSEEPSTDSETTTNLADISHAINTSGKYIGKSVFNTTTSQPVWAVGATAGAVWVDATGSTAHTPS